MSQEEEGEGEAGRHVPRRGRPRKGHGRMVRRGVGRRRNGPRDEGRRSKKQRDKTLDLITGWCGVKLPSSTLSPQGKAYQTYSPLPPSLTPSPYQTPTDTACPLLAMELFRIHPAFLSKLPHMSFQPLLGPHFAEEAQRHTLGGGHCWCPACLSLRRPGRQSSWA